MICNIRAFLAKMISKRDSSDLNKKIQVEIDKRIHSGKPDLIKTLDSEALDALYRYIIPHQDCWILNAIPASSMYFVY